MHPDEQALTQAVLATPDDDTLRLILADWFEERGDPRGEFIRVQCELGNTVLCDTTGTPRFQSFLDDCDELGPCETFEDGPTGRCAYCNHAEICHHKVWDLRRRERQLWTPRNYVNWTPLFLHQGSGVGIASVEPGTVIVTGNGMQTYTFRRGFVERVRCELAMWRGETCRRCNGKGFIQTKFDATDLRSPYPRKIDGPMEHCHGPQIVRACPITRVECSDTPTTDRWFDGRVWANREGLDVLDGDLFNPLKGGNLLANNAVRIYASPSAANVALSDALIAWAKLPLPAG